MKISLTKKEQRVLEQTLIENMHEPLKEVPGIMKLQYVTDGLNIEINEKYITTMGGEINKWLPGIVGSVKGLVSILRLFSQSVDTVEKSLYKELTTKELKEKKIHDNKEIIK